MLNPIRAEGGCHLFNNEISNSSFETLQTIVGRVSPLEGQFLVVVVERLHCPRIGEPHRNTRNYQTFAESRYRKISET